MGGRWPPSWPGLKWFQITISINPPAQPSQATHHPAARQRWSSEEQSIFTLRKYDYRCNKQAGCMLCSIWLVSASLVSCQSCDLNDISASQERAFLCWEDASILKERRERDDWTLEISFSWTMAMHWEVVPCRYNLYNYLQDAHFPCDELRNKSNCSCVPLLFQKMLGKLINAKLCILSPPPLRRRGKILCVSYGPDSSVTQRSTVMRKLRKSTTALRLSHKSKWKQF